MIRFFKWLFDYLLREPDCIDCAILTYEHERPMRCFDHAHM